MKRKQTLPEGMSEKEVLDLIAHFESQTDEEVIERDEAAFGHGRCAIMEVPLSLVDQVRSLIARAAKSKKTKAA